MMYVSDRSLIEYSKIVLYKYCTEPAVLYTTNKTNDEESDVCWRQSE